MRVGVVGLGTMGAGIAQVAVTAGDEVVGREVSDELAERGRATIERYLNRGVDKNRMSDMERDAALGRLSLTTRLGDLADCDVVIEAVLEERALKREVFAELDRVCRPDAVLATNTSALSVAEIAEATQRPERVVGMHFFNRRRSCPSSRSCGRRSRRTPPCVPRTSGRSARASSRSTATTRPASSSTGS